MRSRIEVDKSKIPYQFQILLGGKRYSMEWQYNSANSIFTCTLYDTAGDVLIYGEPLIYGNPMFSFPNRGTVFPAIDLVPLDESGEETEVTWVNFGETVFLTLDDEKKSAEST